MVSRLSETMCDERFANMPEAAPKTNSELPKLCALPFPLQLGPSCESSAGSFATKGPRVTGLSDVVVCCCYPTRRADNQRIMPCGSPDSWSGRILWQMGLEVFTIETSGRAFATV